jgi:hypothetical protein
MTGKGHTQRPYDPQKFAESFDRIFGIFPKKETCSYPFCNCELASPVPEITCIKGLPWKKEEKK